MKGAAGMNKAYLAKNNKRARTASLSSCLPPKAFQAPSLRPPPKAISTIRGAGPGSQASPAACALRDPSSIESLIREGAALKNEIDSQTARLRLIHLRLAESARFENGKKTAHLVGAGYKVKVRLHENIAWDQEKILKFREYVPEEKFCELFKAVYEPTSRKEIDGFIAHAGSELSNGLKWCMSVKPGAPQVTYEKLCDRNASQS
jgi:hypothetical protein